MSDPVRIIVGDCLEAMRGMDAASVDAIVTDPPYGLSFMGKHWDHGVPGVDFWAEALRVAKPGAHLLAFGGTRTYHRLACAIEDAGWEVRDCIAWVYGSGFPKSHNLRGEWSGWGTALKPAFEPIIVARKPLIGTVAENVTTHGTGAINVDGCRIHCFGESLRGGGVGTRSDGWDRPWKSDPSAIAAHKEKCNANADRASSLGRWPANLIHDGSAEVVGLFPSDGEQSAARFFYCAKASKSERWDYLSCDCEAPIFPAWESEGRSRSDRTGYTSPARDTCAGSSTDDSSSLTLPLGNAFTDACPEDTKSITSTRTSRTTASKTCGSSVPPSTSAFIPGASCAATNGGSRAESAASSSPSTRGIGTSPERDGPSMGVAVPATSLRSSETSNCGNCGKPFRRVGHPTVKPTSLMRYLCRLVTPPGGIVLDPFAGSGSTGKGAVLEGFNFIGIELDAEYAEIARARIGNATSADKGLFA